MAKVITVTNQKGGVGKTTGSTHLALALQKAGYSVLFVDLDAQGHATLFLTSDMSLAKRTGGAEKLFDAPADLKPIRTPSGVDLLHGHQHLGSLDEGSKSSQDAVNLKGYIHSLPYDFIVIDTPPALMLRQFAAIIWADILVVMSDTGVYSLSGVAAVKGVVDMLRANNLLDSNFQFRVLFNRFDTKSPTDKAVQAKFREMYGDSVVNETLPYSDAFKTVEATREPIWDLKYMPKRFRELFLSLPSLIGAI
jgi:chromosome partitioning protein